MPPLKANMPGPILLITRPEGAARRFVVQLNMKVETVVAPLIQIEPIALGPVSPGLWGIILTSENGAIAAGQISGLPRRAWCVGDQTAEAALAAGFDPISAGADAAALVTLILSQSAQGPLLHIRGEHARGDVAGRLNAAGFAAQEIVAYRQLELPLDQAARIALAGGRPVVIPLFSPRSGSILAQSGPFTAPLHVICISPTVAFQAKALEPHSCVTVDNPDGTAMIRAVRRKLELLQPH